MTADLLEQMRAIQWATGRLAMLKGYAANGLLFRAGKGTSHCHAKHPSAVEILPILARRPIKPVYIRKLVHYIDAHGDR